MSRTICLIDDEIKVPASVDNTKMLNVSNLKQCLIEADDWNAPELRSLIEKLVLDPVNWKVSAFVHPNLYLNAVEEEGFGPEIIIYDWEYPAGAEDTATVLASILKATYAAVYIYSGTGHETVIDAALASEGLRGYNGKRLFKLMKTSGSPDEILKQAETLSKSNFSFKFGKNLRLATLKAVDSVLVECGNHDKDFVHNLIDAGEAEKSETTLKEFVAQKVMNQMAGDKGLLDSLISEGGLTPENAEEVIKLIQGKLSSVLSSMKIDLSDFNTAAADIRPDAATVDTLKGLWALRLYYTPSDDIVRAGDVIYNSTDGCNYLVITPNCHLAKFWEKTFGHINVIPLYDVKEKKDDILRKLQLKMSADKASKKLNEELSLPNSLTENVNGFSESPFILPFLTNGEAWQYLMGFPKEIRSIAINHPTGKNENPRILAYAVCSDIKRICSLSEPFNSALIHRCIANISGSGAPNYPPALKTAIREDTLVVSQITVESTADNASPPQTAAISKEDNNT